MSLRLTSARATAARAAADRPTKAAAAPATGRRAALAAGLLAAAPAFNLIAPRRAAALIPDEEDEELLERAKANRAARIAKNNAATRDFIRDEGLSNKALQGDLAPVQRAIAKLAQSGAQLEAGDVRAAASALGGDWDLDLKKASVLAAFADADAGKASTAALVDAIKALRASAGKGDLPGSKRRYVAAVGALRGWADAAGVAQELKGL